MAELRDDCRSSAVVAGKRRVRKRFAFAFEGAHCVLLVYTDGHARIRVDHPSNDPVVEGMIGGRLAQRLSDDLDAAGAPVEVGPVSWHSDPDGTAPTWHRRR